MTLYEELLSESRIFLLDTGISGIELKNIFFCNYVQLRFLDYFLNYLSKYNTSKIEVLVDKNFLMVQFQITSPKLTNTESLSSFESLAD